MAEDETKMRGRALAFIAITVAIAVAVTPLSSQILPQSPSFEGISIKPDVSPQPNLYMQFTPSLIRLGLSTMDVIRYAYSVRDFQIIGSPSWLSSKIYVIEAKTEGTMAQKLAMMSPEDREAQSKLLLQSLLADRFGLKIHRQAKDVPSFDLIVAKPGRLRASQTDCNSGRYTPSPEAPGKLQAASCLAINGHGHIAGLDMPISQLAGFLTFDLQQTVTDKTGLAGHYDIILDWAPDPTQTPVTQPGAPYPQADPSGPSLQTALEEQLGMKLVSTKTAANFIVIDHIEPPTEN